VTGATGYVGSEFIRFSQNRYKIIALVRDQSNTIKIEKLKCKIIKFNTYNDLNLIFKNNIITGVVHFASNIVINHSANNIIKLIDSNIKFGVELLEASKESNVKWFLNTGTFWQNYKDEDYSPVNLYASTKEAFENIAKFYTQTSNLIFTTIKLNDTFGSHDTRDKIFNLWNKVLQSGEVLDMSAGEQIIDISYIEDVVNAYIIMIENFNQDNIIQYNNKTFVVSNNERPTLKELSKIFEDITNSKLNINWGSREYREREVMIPYTRGVSVPHWKQNFTLKEAIQNTLNNRRTKC
jgi:nucleoside-diphosphate-sugar epimerase